MSLGFNIPVIGQAEGVQTWRTKENYVVDEEIVIIEGSFRNYYTCFITHISGVWATDKAANKWVRVSDPASGAPAAHAASHQHSGSDEVATATPGNNAIPKTDGSGNLVLNGLIINDTKAIKTGLVDDDYVLLQAVDNDTNALVEVARLTGAATPTLDILAGRLTGTFDPNGQIITGYTIGSDIQAYDAGLASLASLAYVSTSFVKYTAADTFTLDTATYQPSDATLISIALLGTEGDKTIYTTGIDTWAETGLTAFGRSIIDDADEATFKATVNLEIGTDVQAYDATLTALAGLTYVSAAFIKITAADTFECRTLIDVSTDLINDSGSGIGDIWSASKITSEITIAKNAFDPKINAQWATTAVLPAYTGTGTGILTLTGQTAWSPDGTAVVNTDRVLVKEEGAGTHLDNGLYVVSGVGVEIILTRTSDADISAEVTAGMYVFVDKGTTNGNTAWVLTTDDPITLNTTALYFGKYSGLGQINAGAGLTQTYDTLNVIGTASRIIVNADSIDIHSDYVGQTSITTLGTITTGVWNAGAGTFAGNILLPDPGTSANSYSITLTADNSGTPQSGSIQVMYGADPYLRISAPNDSGVATAILDLKDTRVVIGAGTAGVDYEIYFNGETNQGILTYMEDEDRLDWDGALNISGTVTLGTALGDSYISSAATWNSKQAGDAGLTSLASLAYVSSSFVKLTGADTFTLDTGSYQPLDSTLTALAGLGAAPGFIVVVDGDTIIIDANTYITQLADDLTPTLGGNLTANGSHIIFNTDTGILDANSNEMIYFHTNATAVNYWELNNSATGAALILAAKGTDTNVGITIAPKGDGEITLGGFIATLAGDNIRFPSTAKSLTGSVNDYAIGDGFVFEFTADGDYNITGIAAPGTAGRVITIINSDSSNRLYLPDESALSTTTNRIRIANAGTLTLNAYDCAILRYNDTLARWTVIGNSFML